MKPARPTSGVSLEGTAWVASPTAGTKGTPADLDNARNQFPARTSAEWVALFDRAPHVWADLLGDMFRELKALEQREAGHAKIGRRPRVVAGTLAELEAITTPQLSMDPFPVAVRELIGGRSLRAFAARVPMNHHTLTRMMRGELAVPQWRLEAIAKAGRVSPAFFREWREAEVLAAFGAVLAARPNVSIHAHRKLQAARRA